MIKDRELAVPDEVAADANAVEFFRAWLSNGGLVCVLRPTHWKDPRAWGMFLADAARHIANGIRDEVGTEPAATIAGIREMFNLELDAPTDEPTGSFVE